MCAVMNGHVSRHTPHVRSSTLTRSTARPAQASEQHPLSAKFLPTFEDREVTKFQVGIMGDLHLEPNQMPMFHEAREQFRQHMSDGEGKPLPGARMVQLGDLGGYKFQPGSRDCFRIAKEFMDGFPVPCGLVLGNHDLEGAEFETDEENLAAWHETFQQPHYWAAELGPALLVGLSTTRFRSNKYSVHEVHIDDQQLAWLDSVVEENKDRPIIMFTHAPAIGSGLKVLQQVHVKNRCAWLNHSSNPTHFIRLVERYPNIRLWFSGHFHLSHNYPTSISRWGTTAFAQTGVIGQCNRDGFRHSRYLEGDEEGYQLYTLDHDTGALRLDMAHRWDDTEVPKVVTPMEQLISDESASESGWLCSQLDCGLPQVPQQTKWFFVGEGRMLALQDGLLVEYDTATRAPIGLVASITDGTEVVLQHEGDESADGSSVAAVLIVDSLTKNLVSRFERNEWGGFFRIYQPNKWRLKKEQEAATAAAQAAQLVAA